MGERGGSGLSHVWSLQKQTLGSGLYFVGRISLPNAELGGGCSQP